MDFNLLMDLRRHLTIKHHVPGRVRIKFGLKLLTDPKAQALKKHSEGKASPDCIHSTKVNFFTRNVIIEYDPEILVPEKLHEALTTLDQARFDKLIAEFETIING